jgi:hypothetical protein
MIEGYWEIVEQCLIQFHGLKNDVATSKVTEIRKAMGSGQYNVESYHTEPFSVAWQIAKGEVLTSAAAFNKESMAYKQIMDSAFKHAADLKG